MRVALLGAGHIARALSAGWSSSTPPAGRRPSLAFFDPAPGRAAELAAAVGGSVAADAATLVAANDLVVLAMRPQDVAAALDDIAPVVGSRPVVSLAAYVTLDRLGELLPEGARVGRVMPNVAVAVGRGVALLVEGSLGESAAAVEGLFALTATVLRVSEQSYDAATAVGGCGPAFAAYALAAFAEAGVRHGLDRRAALEIAAVAMEGAAVLVRRGDDPDELVSRVAVPGGMTAAGVEALEKRGARATLGAAVDAAVARAAERR